MNRQSVALQTAYALTGHSVVTVMIGIARRRELPSVINIDHATDFKSNVLDECC